MEPTPAEVAAARGLPNCVSTGTGLPWTSEAVVRALTAPLRGFTRVYLDWTLGQTGSPQAFQLGGALAALAGAVPTDYCVPDIPGGEAHSNLFVMLVGSAGASRKTTALKRMRTIMGQAGAARIGDEPGSEAGLVKTVTEQPDNHIVLLYPEMGDFFAFTADRSGGNQAGVLKTKLMNLYDREPMTRRLSKARFSAECPHGSVFGCINPRLIAQHVPAGDWETGLMSRFLILWAESERNVLRTSKDPREDWLRGFIEAAVQAPSGTFGPCIGLEPDAEDYWIAWMLKVESSLPTGTNARVCGPMARAPHIALRVAILLAFGEGFGWPAAAGSQGQPWRIPRWIVEIAAKIATMGYQSSLLLAEHAVNDTDMRKRQEVLAAIGTEWMPLGDVLRSAGILRNRAAPILDTLQVEGLIEQRSVYDKTGTTYYRRTPAVDVNGDPRAETSAADAAFTERAIERAITRHGIAPVADPAQAPPPSTEAPAALPLSVRPVERTLHAVHRIIIEIPIGTRPSDGMEPASQTDSTGTTQTGPQPNPPARWRDELKQQLRQQTVPALTTAAVAEPAVAELTPAEHAKQLRELAAAEAALRRLAQQF